MFHSNPRFEHLFGEEMRQGKRTLINSSLHWIISLYFCLFSYDGECSDQLRLSVVVGIVNLKSSNGDRQPNIYGLDFNSPMETTLMSPASMVCITSIQVKYKLVLTCKKC